MLNFFKKSGRQLNDGKTPNCSETHRRNSTSERDSSVDDTILDESFIAGVNEKPESRSRLSKNLQEIISDKNCLIYFVQYLEMKKNLPLIKFCLDAENFKTAAELCFSSNLLSKTFETKPQNQVDCFTSIGDHKSFDDRRSIISDDLAISMNSTCGGIMHRSASSDAYDSLSFTSFDMFDRVSLSSYSENNLRDLSLRIDEKSDSSSNKLVPELKTLCDVSMRRSLTDDEKSRIFEETSKKNAVDGKNAKTNSNSDSKREKARSSIAADAIRIYKKYLSSHSQFYIDIPATILSSISLSLCTQGDDHEMIPIPSNCFEEARAYVLSRLEKEYLNEFLESSFYCKYCVEILTGGGLKLADILYSEAALFYFMEYLEQEKKRDYLEFWMAAINYKKHYEKVMKTNMNSFDPKEAQNDAMILYDKYFSLQATCPLQISDSVRSHVEESICTECDTVVQCFDLPIKIIESFLDTKYFSSFISSQLFVNYLNEIRSKIKDNNTIPKRSSVQMRRHRKTFSDCTSNSTQGIRNSCISQHNTLLAMETSARHRSSKSTTDMQIDSRQLTNPDLLWHRHSTGGLTFGRVNSLGRYERDFEIGTHEEKWSIAAGGNKIKNAVRKLVNLPEDKVQEEIAWQVAEMIVKDITSITLRNENESSG